MRKSGLGLVLLAAAIIASMSALSCTKRTPATTATTVRAEPFSFSRKPSAGITFLSTQLNPVEEAWKMRNAILKDFPGTVDFRPNDNAYLLELIDSEFKKNPTASILVGALHGDLKSLYERNALQPLNEQYQQLNARGFSQDLMQLSRFNGRDASYIPWMQASFVMAANRKALPYLPKGASLENLTYQQLQDWASNIYKKTGKKALGFPAGEKGLMHRFFQGYLYPSFTDSTLLKFRTPKAVSMWEFFKRLWSYVQPSSLVYSTMSEPLLIDEVWIAWDHTARLMKAFQERPDDFVAFPAPRGPKGRGFLAVISGLALPAAEPDTANAAMLIDYLTQPAIQERTLMETGFFPVLGGEASDSLPIYLRNLDKAIKDQMNGKNSILTLMPMGLGDQAGKYNSYFMLTFSEIVLEGKDIQGVLDRNARKLQEIIDKENLECWLPDTSAERPCKIE
jgi:multiple sugar transport system substrate-binding protein